MTAAPCSTEEACCRCLELCGFPERSQNSLAVLLALRPASPSPHRPVAWWYFPRAREKGGTTCEVFGATNRVDPDKIKPTSKKAQPSIPSASARVLFIFLCNHCSMRVLRLDAFHDHQLCSKISLQHPIHQHSAHGCMGPRPSRC